MELQRQAARSEQNSSVAVGSERLPPASFAAKCSISVHSVPGHEEDGDAGNSALPHLLTVDPTDAELMKLDCDQWLDGTGSEIQNAISERQEPGQTNLTNPLAVSPSTFMAASNGRSCS